MAEFVSDSTKPVAYFYELNGVGKELLLDCNGEYARKLLEAGYTETPLFTRAAPPAMDREAVGKLVEPWADYHGDLPEYDHPLRPVFESGIQYAVELLAKELGVTDWAPCDGTEEFDGDLGGTLVNIVLAAMPKDKDGDPIHPRDLLSTLSADAIRQGEGLTIPADIAQHVRKIGKVEWGQTPAHDADGHGRHVTDSVRLTAAHFGQTDDQHMHGLWLEGTETVLCHTGTSPNAPKTTQALVGAWNWLVDQALAAPASHASDGGEA